MSLNLNFQSQSHWSLFNGTWQKRPRELDHRLRFEIEDMTLQMQQTGNVANVGVFGNVADVGVEFASCVLSLMLCIPYVSMHVQMLGTPVVAPFLLRNEISVQIFGFHRNSNSISHIL